MGDVQGRAGEAVPGRRGVCGRWTRGRGGTGRSGTEVTARAPGLVGCLRDGSDGKRVDDAVDGGDCRQVS